MSAASIAMRGNAKPNMEEVFRGSGRSLPPNEAIARVARALWPVKTDLELSIRAGTSDRACRELLAGRGGMSLEAVANLLRSEDGLEFLMALLGDASPTWRRLLEDCIDISMTRAELEAQRNRIAELELRAGQQLSVPKKPPIRYRLPRRR